MRAMLVALALVLAMIAETVLVSNIQTTMAYRWAPSSCVDNAYFQGDQT